MGGCFNIDYTGQNITTANLSSTNNYKNGSKTTITISKSSSCKIYTEANIYIHTNNTTTAPIDTVQALRYKIVSEDNVEYDGYISRFCDVLMATVPIEDTSKTYTVYIWIDNSKSYGEYDGKSYSGYVYATSIQTSTIEKDDIPENYLNTDCPGITNIGFSYIGKSQEYTIPKTGTYKIEAWGAQGGNNTRNNDSLGGKGGYTSGNIQLNKDTKIYFYVGSQGESQSNSSSPKGGYNGGGNAVDTSNQSTGGGGATDIRLISGTFDSFESLKSRIMVAGGGGGTSVAASGNPNYFGIGGSSGGLNGFASINVGSNASDVMGTGATQIKGGNCSNSSSLGVGGFGYGGIAGVSQGAGGGSGYYGGGGACYCAPGGGGSSFISGHDGCDAIDKNSTSDNIIHTGQSVHYSGYEFTDTVMIDGSGCKWTNQLTNECNGMPTHDGTSTMIGNSGNGYAKITFIE